MDYEPTDPHKYTRCAPFQSLTALPLTRAIFICSRSPHKEMSESDSRRLETVVVARPTNNSARKNAMSGLRSHFESKSHSKNSKSPIEPEFPPTSTRNGHPEDVELDIRVCVERSVKVDYGSYEHSSSWDKPTA
jgi:hypothetical protein